MQWARDDAEEVNDFHLQASTGICAAALFGKKDVFGYYYGL